MGEQAAYDVVVIGSGVGGLSAASLLTQRAGKKVLVLERHFKLGGFNHAFQRKGFHWDVGLHYVGQMAPGAPMRGMMDLVTGGDLDWNPMPHGFDVLHYPGLTFTIPADAEEYAARLVALFPEESAAIHRYFRDIRAAAAWYAREVVAWNLPAPLAAGVSMVQRRHRRLALTTTGDYLTTRFREPRLRALLASQWGDYGVPPQESAFAQHALIVDHYLDGGWYPVGGSDAMTEAMAGIVVAGGGATRVYSTVEEILVERGRAVGVRAAVKRGRDSRVEEIRAPIVISAAGARATFETLLAAPTPQAALVAAQPAGVACATAYVGLRESAESLGFRGENHWYFSDSDHDATARSSAAMQGRPRYGYLSFPSLKDPRATRHTAEIITTVPVSEFAAWDGTSWQHRGENYEALKNRIGAGLVDLVETHVPGFGALVEHVEVSTPLTVADFAGYRSGSFADLAGTPDRFRRKLFPSQVMPGLFLAGADTMGLGIVGAMMGGVVAAGSAMGPFGVPQIMAAARRGASQAERHEQ